jgi:acyl carrier protein
VRQAVVVSHPGQVPGEGAIVGYVVPHAGKSVATTRELRAFVQEILPSPMVPAAFVSVPALPVTATGKVDRGALRALGSLAREPERPFVPPRTPVEKALAILWADVLSHTEIGAEDGFLELGGHSLSAMRLLARIREVFDVELPMETLLSEPRLSSLAVAIERAFLEKTEAVTDGGVTAIPEDDAGKPSPGVAAGECAHAELPSRSPEAPFHRGPLTEVAGDAPR